MASAKIWRKCMTDQIFVTHKELDFISDLNKEMIRRITGQKIKYYSIDMTATKIHDVYGESVQKVYKTPVELECLVEFEDPVMKSTDIQTEIQYSLWAYFHKRMLAEYQLFPQDGDYIQWGVVFYEITLCTEPQLQFGRIEDPMMIKCHCRFLRKDEVGIPVTENIQENY